jgi:hypothetical protein
MWDFTWRVSDCEELVGHPIEHLGRNATNYFMYQWAGARLPPGGQIIVQAAPASELILYIGPHLTPD